MDKYWVDEIYTSSAWPINMTLEEAEIRLVIIALRLGLERKNVPEGKIIKEKDN